MYYRASPKLIRLSIEAIEAELAKPKSHKTKITKAGGSEFPRNAEEYDQHCRDRIRKLQGMLFKVEL